MGVDNMRLPVIKPIDVTKVGDVSSKPTGDVSKEYQQKQQQSTTSALERLNSSITRMNNINDNINNNINKSKARPAPAPASPSPASPSPSTDLTKKKNVFTKTYDKIINKNIQKIKESHHEILLLEEIEHSKIVLLESIIKDNKTIKTYNDKTYNYNITTKRLTQLYAKTLSTEEIYNNILRVIGIIMVISAGFIFKDDIKDAIMGTPSQLPIYKNPQIPTIVSLLLLILFSIWLFNNREIHEMSFYMFTFFIINIFFIQGVTIRLDDDPKKNIMYALAILPIVIFYIIEIIDIDNHIIPVHKSNLPVFTPEDIKERVETIKSLSKFNIMNEINTLSSGSGKTQIMNEINTLSSGSGKKQIKDAIKRS